MSSLRNIPMPIWLISIASFLITGSAAMFFSVFALFLKSLGTTLQDIALIDGFVEGFGYLLKVFSGIMSDYLKKRTAIFAVGAFFTAISRPLLLIFLSFQGAVIARIFDRFGNGLQATPRDALIADYAPSSLKGTCFGIRQCLGTLGSVIGAFAVTQLLRFYTDDFRLVFFVAGIPAFLAFFIIIFYVRDRKNIPQKGLLVSSVPQETRRPFHFKDLAKLGHSYWFLMIVVAVFMACRFSESLIILYGENAFNLTNANAVWIMFIYNLAWSISAYVTGKIADKVPAAPLIIGGALITASANILMLIAGNYTHFLIGVVGWGIQIGLMQNVFCTGITALVPKELRGTGLGFFYFISAISIVVANSIGGHLMHSNSPYTFVYSASVSLFVCFIMLAYQYMKKNLSWRL